MPSARYRLVFALLLALLSLPTAFEECAGKDPPEKFKVDPPKKFNTVKKSLDGVVLFTATIAEKSLATEPVLLSLQLKNDGEEILAFSDVPFDTFLLKVKTKDGAVVPATRYLESRLKPERERGRYVIIELAPGKAAGLTLPLDRLFDLSLEGEYLVSIEAKFTANRVAKKVVVENLPLRMQHPPFVRITNVK